MDIQTLISILKNPARLGELHLIQLEEVVKEYPFFNAAQILLAKKYQLDNNPQFEIQLQKAAVYSPDRKILFNFIRQNFNQNDTQKENYKPEIAYSEEKSDRTTENIIPSKDESTILANKEITIPVEYPTELKKVSPPIEDKSEEEKKNYSIEINLLNTNEKHSFNEWLHLLMGNKITERSEIKMEVEEKTSINTDFQEIPNSNQRTANIEQNKDINVEELALKSLREDENLISVTLADIYANQGNYIKAIKLYEKLSLQFPEKKDKFAEKIRNLKTKL